MPKQAFQSIEAQDPAFYRFRRRVFASFAGAMTLSLIVGAYVPTLGIFIALWGGGGLILYAVIELYHRTQVEGFYHFRQIQALMSLHALIPFRQPLPPTRLWAASPDLLTHLLSLIKATNPTHIVELGSGVSTLIGAYALEAQESGRITSFDHDAVFAEKTRELLALHGLSEYVTVIDAPLHDGWYDRQAMSELAPIDLLIVDGPPSLTVESARFAALPVLYTYLRSGAIVLVDDYMREAEYTMVHRWLAEFEVELVEEIANDKGAAILRKR